jgi:hypothetical protein
VNILNEHQNTMKKLQRMVENQRSIAQWIKDNVSKYGGSIYIKD